MYEFVVDAKANSVSGGTLLNTGIKLVPNQLLTVSVPVDEAWFAGPSLNSNANGRTTAPVFTHKGLTAFSGSLVGSLDGGNSFFGIGTRLEMSILIPSGILSLGYWDSDNFNNSGSVTATVAVYTGPA